LESLDLRAWLDPASARCRACANEIREADRACVCHTADGVNWVIVGGESGLNHRTMDPTWPRDLRDQCVAAGVPFFFKQWGGRTPKAGGRDLDGRFWDEMPGLPVQAILESSKRKGKKIEALDVPRSLTFLDELL
jgi:protein gp37